MAVIRANGMIAFPGPTKAGVGAETVGWNIDDEVDMWAGPGWAVYPAATAGYDFMASATSVSGPQGPMVADGRIKLMNYGKGIIFWETNAEAAVFTNGESNAGKSFTLNAVSADLHFYSDNNTITDATTYLGIPAGEIRRATNYGRHVIDKIRKLQHSAGIYQAVYGYVETASQGANVAQATLTGDMIEGAVWACLIHETRGIIYFVHDFIYSGSNHCLRDNIGGYTARVRHLNARITALTPVLNTQSIASVFNWTGDTMTKVTGGFTNVFAMSVRQGTRDTTPRTFTLPISTTATTVTALNESRTLTITAGAFVDSFAAEFTCHIYKFAT